MTDMIERVARAMTEAMNQAPVSDEQWQRAMAQTEDREVLFGWCRAAIEAMREPTPAMIAAGEWDDGAPTGRYITESDAEAVWQDMIAAALEEAGE